MATCFATFSAKNKEQNHIHAQLRSQHLHHQPGSTAAPAFHVNIYSKEKCICRHPQVFGTDTKFHYKTYSRLQLI